MASGLLKRTQKQTHQYWHGEGSGYEKTDSIPVINHLLTHLKNKRTPLTLVTSGYQSEPSVLIDVTGEKLLIAKPKAWPVKTTDNKDQHVRLIFKDAAHKWNHFDVRVIGTSGDTVTFSWPQTLFRLEQRKNFRVSAPTGARISFSCNSDHYEEVILNDFSASGMLFSMSETTNMKGTQLSDISLSLPNAEEDSHYIQINKGEIVRFIRDQTTRIVAFGVSFQVTSKEKESLLQIVRQQEITISQEQRQQSAPVKQA